MPGVAARTRSQVGAARLEPAQLGRIIVARFLELPLRAFERRVHALEQAPDFRALDGILYVGRLTGLAPLRARGTTGNRLLGVIHVDGDKLAFRYASPAFDCVYLFDETAVAERAAKSRTTARLIGNLRLVNTRNRLTHAVVQTLMGAQTEFLLSGDPLGLRALSQAALARRLRTDGVCPVDADPSRLSRLLRYLTVRLPDGEIAPLRSLCPAARTLHRYYVGQILRQEQAILIEDETLVPMTDREIARAALRQFDARLLTRTVSYIRHDLGIPAARERRHRSKYLAATVGFSPVLPLSEEVLRVRVPPGPGVYELRCDRAAPDTCPIIYLGSARNLPKRLVEHLRGYSGNALLRPFVEEGVRFRYLRVAEGWREVERAVYRAYCATFDGPPACNRLSP
ncbi:MAG: hypothetical protein EPN55_00685 [Gammaproteobacteria bacterium]|nr:MAG: hypothetical protein EPN55_00685 [Gammaproteobacteria bacterium]